MPKKRPAKDSRFGVYLDLATRRALLDAAVDENTSATRLVERLIREYLSRRRPPRGGG